MIGQTSSIHIPSIFSKIVKLKVDKPITDSTNDTAFPTPGDTKIRGYTLASNLSFEDYNYLIIMPSKARTSANFSSLAFISHDLYAPPLIYHYIPYSDSRVTSAVSSIANFNKYCIVISWYGYSVSGDTLLDGNFNSTVPRVFRRGVVIGSTVIYYSTIYYGSGTYTASNFASPSYELHPDNLYLAKK